MVLGFKLLDNVVNVNQFMEVNTLRILRGNNYTIYFRLISRDMQNVLEDIRYIPQAGASVSVVFQHIDSNKVLNKTAINPFPNDTSIWSITLTSNEVIMAGTMEVTLTEGTNVYKLVPFSNIKVEEIGQGRYFA